MSQKSSHFALTTEDEKQQKQLKQSDELMNIIAEARSLGEQLTGRLDRDAVLSRQEILMSPSFAEITNKLLEKLIDASEQSVKVMAEMQNDIKASEISAKKRWWMDLLIPALVLLITGWAFFWGGPSSKQQSAQIEKIPKSLSSSLDNLGEKIISTQSKTSEKTIELLELLVQQQGKKVDKLTDIIEQHEKSITELR